MGYNLIAQIGENFPRNDKSEDLLEAFSAQCFKIGAVLLKHAHKQGNAVMRNP